MRRMGLRVLCWLERRRGAVGLTPLLLPPLEWLTRGEAREEERAAQEQERALQRLLALLLHLRPGAVLDAEAGLLRLCARIDRGRPYLGFDPRVRRCAEAEWLIRAERLAMHTVLPVRLAAAGDSASREIAVTGDTVVEALRPGPAALLAVTPESAGALGGCRGLLARDRPWVLCRGGPPPPCATAAMKEWIWFRLESDTALVCAEPPHRPGPVRGDWLAAPGERAGELIAAYGRTPGGTRLFA